MDVHLDLENLELETLMSTSINEIAQIEVPVEVYIDGNRWLGCQKKSYIFYWRQIKIRVGADLLKMGFHIRPVPVRRTLPMLFFPASVSVIFSSLDSTSWAYAITFVCNSMSLFHLPVIGLYPSVVKRESAWHKMWSWIKITQGSTSVRERN